MRGPVPVNFFWSSCFAMRYVIQGLWKTANEKCSIELLKISMGSLHANGLLLGTINCLNIGTLLHNAEILPWLLFATVRRAFYRLVLRRLCDEALLSVEPTYSFISSWASKPMPQLKSTL